MASEGDCYAEDQVGESFGTVEMKIPRAVFCVSKTIGDRVVVEQYLWKKSDITCAYALTNTEELGDAEFARLVEERGCVKMAEDEKEFFHFLT